jgi:hypothetical protein
VPTMTISLVLLLAAFCLLFAINSSIHSYLVVRYAEGDKVAMNVGFYYMANALGRLTGRGSAAGAAAAAAAGTAAVTCCTGSQIVTVGHC